MTDTPPCPVDAMCILPDGHAGFHRRRVSMTRTAPEIVTRVEIAKRFGVTRQAVYDWCSDSTFPPPVRGVYGAMCYEWGAVKNWRAER